MEDNVMSLKYVNFFRTGRGIYNLPVVDEEGKPLQDGAEVEVCFLSNALGRHDIRCNLFPIRHGRTYGNRIQLDEKNTNMRSFSFIFDAMKEVWELVYDGYICFHEQEVGTYRNTTGEHEDH